MSVLQVVSQTGRLKIPLKLRLSQLLQGELLNFKSKIDPATAHDSYSAWREADHDDLLLATALACWYAEGGKNPQHPVFYAMPGNHQTIPGYRIPGESRAPLKPLGGRFGGVGGSAGLAPVAALSLIKLGVPSKLNQNLLIFQKNQVQR
jgi:hypothetical protein